MVWSIASLLDGKEGAQQDFTISKSRAMALLAGSRQRRFLSSWSEGEATLHF